MNAISFLFQLLVSITCKVVLINAVTINQFSMPRVWFVKTDQGSNLVYFTLFFKSYVGLCVVVSVVVVVVVFWGEHYPGTLPLTFTEAAIRFTSPP